MAVVAIIAAVAVVGAEGEENWGADKRILLADFAFEETFPGPVQ